MGEGMRTPHPADTLDEFALAAAVTRPAHPAVVEPDRSGRLTTTSYRELAGRVDAYAASLIGLEIATGDRVVVESDTSASAVAMLLACSRLGLAFVPVSPQTPDQRVRTIVAAVEPVLHVRAAGTPGRELDRTGLATFGPDGLAVARRPPERRGPTRNGPVIGTDPVYVIFTSGSTGQPKGVVMSHHGALAFYRGAHRFGLVTPEDRVASTSPLQFDVALFDIGVTLGRGATLVVVPRELSHFPRRLVGLLSETAASTLHAVPSLLHLLMRSEPQALAGLDQLRGFMLTGEDFPLTDLRRLRQLLPGRRLVNAFGATETVAFSFADVPDPLPDDLERLPIGRGYPGGEMFLVDSEGVPVAEPGVVGEIYVRAPSLFWGYWGDPAATREVLVPDPFNPRSGQLVYRSGDLAYAGDHGELYFCGRLDSMVKVRGNRVELGEIEYRLLGHSAVTAAATVPVSSGNGDPTLVAFVVCSSEIAPGDLAVLCKQTLPDYMVPKRFHVVDALPLTPNGKVNRRALAELAAQPG